MFTQCYSQDGETIAVLLKNTQRKASCSFSDQSERGQALLGSLYIVQHADLAPTSSSVSLLHAGSKGLIARDLKEPALDRPQGGRASYWYGRSWTRATTAVVCLVG